MPAAAENENGGVNLMTENRRINTWSWFFRFPRLPPTFATRTRAPQVFYKPPLALHPTMGITSGVAPTAIFFPVDDSGGFSIPVLKR